jgi:hypothetical protein
MRPADDMRATIHRSAQEHAVIFHQNVKKQSDHQNVKKQSGAKGSALSSRRMRNDEIDWISNQKVMQKRKPPRFKVLSVVYDSGAEECKERRGALALEDRVWIGNQKAGWLCPAVQSEGKEATEIGAQEAEALRRANKRSHIQKHLSDFHITPSQREWATASKKVQEFGIRRAQLDGIRKNEGQQNACRREHGEYEYISQHHVRRRCDTSPAGSLLEKMEKMRPAEYRCFCTHPDSVFCYRMLSASIEAPLRLY